MTAKLTRRQLLGAAMAASAAGSLTSAADKTPSDKAHWFGYALNSATIRGQKLSLAEQVEVAAKAGYGGVEPWLGDLSKHVESGGSLKDLRKRCEDLGMKVVGGIGFAQWLVNDDAQRAKGVEQMKRDMDRLAQVGGTHIAAPPAGANKPGVKVELDQAAERYRAILELGRQMGVIPQLEIWGASANLSHLADAIYVAAKAAHPDARVLADVFHLYKGGSDPATLRLLGRQAVHCFHVNDYPATPARDAIKDSDRIWPGDGIAPLKQMLSYLAENHCRVWLSLELFNADYWKLPALDAAKTGLAKMKAVVSAVS